MQGKGMINIKQLGQLAVKPLGFGAMGCSEFYGKINKSEVIKTICRFIDLSGVSAMIDTADCYGLGDNEILIGQILKSYRREDIVLASKCGILRDPDDHSFQGVSNKPEYIHSACSASLKRLKTDYIDLYYLHRLDPEVEIEESLDALKELVQLGYIRYIGLSEVNGAIIKRAYDHLKKTNDTHLLSAIQSEYSIWSRDVERNHVLELCNQLGIGLVAYSPLGRGFLTGKIQTTSQLDLNDYRKTLPRFQQETLNKNNQILESLTPIAKKHHISLSQLALAWLIQKPSVVPIPGTKQLHYLEENMKSLDVTLDQESIQLIDTLSGFNGLRYQKEIIDSMDLIE